MCGCEIDYAEVLYPVVMSGAITPDGYGEVVFALIQARVAAKAKAAEAAAKAAVDVFIPEF